MGDIAGTPWKGSEGDPVHTRLITLAEDWPEAIVSNDATRIGSFMADEWVIVSASGVSAKEQFLSLVESGELTHSAMTGGSRPRIRVYGATAVLTGRVTNTAHYKGQRFDADEWTTDVFVNRNGRWLCVLSHITAAAPGLRSTSPPGVVSSHGIGANSGSTRAEWAGRAGAEGRVSRPRSTVLRCSRARTVVGKSVAAPLSTSA